MIDLHLGANAPRWRFLYAVRIDAYPYTTLASVPNTMTGPATTNIFDAIPVMKPSGCVKIDIHFSLRNYGSPLFSGPPLHRDTVWTKQSYSLPIDTFYL